jgi:RimJ/RimL family protein N-acetyltransferase
MPDSALRPAYRIETAHLILRCWSPGDTAALKSAVDSSVDMLQPWLPWAAHHPLPIEQVVGEVRAMRRRFDGDEDYAYGAFDPGESEVVGGCGLHTRAGPEARELGYWVRADRWGRGLATEMSAALCRVGFEVDLVQRLDLRCEPDNQASARVAEKLGFRHEATLRRRLKPRDGALRDGMLWTMLREEYPASRAFALAADVRAFDLLGRRLL